MRNLLCVLSVCCLVLAGRPALATSFVMMADPDLADLAPFIARVQVEAVQVATAAARPATEYRVRVERGIKGIASGASLVVRVPGGIGSDGLGLKIWGAPRFGVGERALLFLAPNRDGSYRPFHLMLGAFHEVSSGGRRLLVRDFRHTQQLPRPGRTGVDGRHRQPRDPDRFVAWLEDRLAGVARAADYFVEDPEPLQGISEPFTLFEWDGLNLRWFEFDSGGTVPWVVHESGQDGVPGGGFVEFQQGLAAWNADPATPVNLTYDGTTDATGGFSDGGDGLNTLLFDDPNGWIGDPFSCTSGGTLAEGGPRFIPGDTLQFNGQTFLRILEAEIIVNEGIACYFEGSEAGNKAAEELYAHELGHTLGIRHSCGDAQSPSCSSSQVLNDALMRAFVHDDGRGAQLNSDDRAALAALYASSTPGICTPGPTTLCLNDDRFMVETRWETLLGTQGQGQAFELTPDTGYFWFFDEDNVEVIVKVLDACGEPFNRFWVFASGLTNVEVELTVTDTLRGETKRYENPLETPFAPIQDIDGFATCP